MVKSAFSKITCLTIGWFFFTGIVQGFSQSIERIEFSGFSSSNNAFQAVGGTPYTKFLSAPGGSSLTISAEYGKSGFVPLLVKRENSERSSILIFPNPVRHEVTIKPLQPGRIPLSITLFDGLGREIIRQDVKNEGTQLFLHDLPSGVYRLVSEKNTWQIIKL